MNISHRNRFIANPGCYATATELALYPLISNHLIRVDSIIVDAKSGLTELVKIKSVIALRKCKQ